MENRKQITSRTNGSSIAKTAGSAVIGGTRTSAGRNTSPKKNPTHQQQKWNKPVPQSPRKKPKLLLDNLQGALKDTKALQTPRRNTGRGRD